jgi:hypothetical protein
MTIFELHECSDGLKVKLFYFNGTESPTINGTQYKIKTCPHIDCPYDSFLTFISQYIPDYKKECGILEDFDYYQVLKKWFTISDDFIFSDNTYSNANKIYISVYLLITFLLIDIIY